MQTHPSPFAVCDSSNEERRGCADLCYRYINKGLYEKDKLTFQLVLTMKILVTAGLLTRGDVSLFLRAGGGLDRASAQKKPFKWLTDEDAWYNVVELSRSVKFFKVSPCSTASTASLSLTWPPTLLLGLARGHAAQ